MDIKNCPRCTIEKIPNNISPGAYPGAISRVDDKTEICSYCGLEEAIIFVSGRDIQTIDKWPVERFIESITQ